MKKTTTLFLIMLSASALFASLALIKGRTLPFAMISVKQVHTYVYTHDLETFRIPVLISDRHQPHVLEEAISNIRIESFINATVIPLELVDIIYLGTTEFENQWYHRFDYVLRLAFYTEDTTLNVAKATLNFDVYERGEMAMEIGEFNYAFSNHTSQDITVYTRHNVHLQKHEIATSVGMIVTVENTTDEVIEILNVSINSTSIHPNMLGMRVFTESLEAPFELDEGYDLYASPKDQRAPIMLEGYQSLTFLIPFSMSEQSGLLHRYPLIIRYTVGNQVKSLIVDDFMFIRTDVFSASHAHYYVKYD